jgi:hypothetical protein
MPSSSYERSRRRGNRGQERSFLQRAQPALTGLIDGSLSPLAPIFTVALATHRPHYAFFAGLATAIGAGVSMAFWEGLSDTGDLTGRGKPYLRGSITGVGTFLGGILHTLPFLITQYRGRSGRRGRGDRLRARRARVDPLALLRHRFLRSFASITLGGTIIVGIAVGLGGAAG